MNAEECFDKRLCDRLKEVVAAGFRSTNKDKQIYDKFSCQISMVESIVVRIRNAAQNVL